MRSAISINTKSKEWGTPQKYVDAINSFFDDMIDLDPCSNEYSIVNAKTCFKLPEQDGLKETWKYTNIYVNPPYGLDKARKTSIKDWIAKCTEAHELYNSEVLALIPVSPNTQHWKIHVFPKANSICFLEDTRLKFLENGQDSGKGAPMACAMIYWGVNHEKFDKVFKDYGAVIKIRKS